jgi:hypothetical protein
MAGTTSAVDIRDVLDGAANRTCAVTREIRILLTKGVSTRADVMRALTDDMGLDPDKAVLTSSGNEQTITWLIDGSPTCIGVKIDLDGATDTMIRCGAIRADA